MTKIEKLLNKLGEKCKEKHFSLVTAESCTGGGLSYYITINPVASPILERGYVVYSYLSKEDVLGVSSYTLQIFGAVSKNTAIEMAEKSLKKSNAQISIGITGIDEASTKEKRQTGVVWIACAGINKNTFAKKIHVRGDRKKFCEKIIFESVRILLNYID